MHIHSGQSLIFLADLRHIGEIQFRVDPVGEEIHRYSNQIDVSGSLAVSEQRTLDAVRARKDAEFRIRHAAAAVVVRMKTEDDAVPVFHILIQVLDLGSENMRHRRLDRGRNVNDSFPLRGRFPDVQHRVADFQPVLHLGPVEALRAVFEHEVAVGLVRQFLEELRAVYREFLDLFFVLFKDLFPLRNGSGIIEMDHRLRRSLDRFKSLADDVLPGLGENLDRDIVRDHVPLDESAKEGVLRLRSGGESHLDLLKADVYQHAEEFDLLFEAHGLDQRLVAVAQVDAAPDRSLLDMILFRPVQTLFRREKILTHVLPVVHHCFVLSIFRYIRFKIYQKP